MKLNRDLLFIDMEYNAQEEPERKVFEDQIIEIGLVWINRRFEEKSIITFQSVINTGIPLTPYIQDLTKIMQDEVDRTGIKESEAIAVLGQWISMLPKATALVGWGSDALDFRRLLKDKYNTQLDLKCWDIKPVAEFMTGLYEKNNGKRNGLKALMNTWGVKWDSKYGEQHRALADSFNTMRLLQKFDENQQKIRSVINDLKKVT